MGYLSFDCSCKIHASGRFTSTKTDMTGSGGIAGFFRHVSRKDMVEITEKLFGSENIVSWSCHMDEENPHLHVLFVPCHESEISR